MVIQLIDTKILFFLFNVNPGLLEVCNRHTFSKSFKFSASVSKIEKKGEKYIKTHYKPT